MPTKDTFVAYLRVSTAKQGMHGLGIDAQRDRIKQHALATSKPVVAEYVEQESGRVRDRPQLARALALCKLRGCTLLIGKLDRLARNVHFISGLLEAGVDFVACDMPTANKFMLHIMAAVAEQEAEAISERTKAALKAAKARGIVLGAPAHGGWTGIDSQGRDKEAIFTPIRLAGARKAAEKRVRERAEAYGPVILPLARELRERGLSDQQIADWLNADGHTTVRGAKWYQRRVNDLLFWGLDPVPHYQPHYQPKE